MTRKDYVLLAAAIKREADRQPDKECARGFAETVASALATDNPRFDRERFLKACGFDS